VTISASVSGSIVAASATSWRPSAAVASSTIAAVVASGMIPTLPGKPVITRAVEGDDLEFTPPSDGGSSILGYNVYLNGALESALEQESAPGLLNPTAAGPDDLLEIAAVNAVGEGPRSDPFEVTS